MASGAVREDASKLSWIDQGLHRLESWMNLFSGIVVLALMGLAVANIVGRNLFNTPVSGYIDWTEQFMAIFALFAIAYLQRTGGHIRMDIFVSKLPLRLLWLVETIGIVLMLLVTLALLWGSWLHFLRAYHIGDSSIDIALPLWPAKLVVPVALLVLTLRLLLQLFGYLRAFLHNDPVPIAVPVPLDPAQIALQEAQSVQEHHENPASGPS